MVFEKYLYPPFSEFKREDYLRKEKMKGKCIFCQINSALEYTPSVVELKDSKGYVIKEENSVVLLLNLFGYTDLHFLLLPKDHSLDVRELDKSTFNTMFYYLPNKLANSVSVGYGFKNYSMGLNSSKISGASIEHLHLHWLVRSKQEGKSRERFESLEKTTFNISSHLYFRPPPLKRKKKLFCKECKRKKLMVKEYKFWKILVNDKGYNSWHFLLLPNFHREDWREISEEEFEEFGYVFLSLLDVLEELYFPGEKISYNFGLHVGGKHLKAHLVLRKIGDCGFLETTDSSRVFGIYPEKVAVEVRKKL